MLRNDSSKPAATRSPGNVLRRSKTSIRNPIKKLFRSSSNAKTLDEGNADLQPNIPTRAPMDQQRLTQRSSSSDTLFSTRNMERQNYSLTPTLPTIHSPSTAAADVYPFQPDHWQQQKQRPPSVHSTKSVRNIFSSAKQRLSLRKSTFFPRQTHQPSDSVNLSAMSEAPLLSALTDQTHHALPASGNALHSVVNDHNGGLGEMTQGFGGFQPDFSSNPEAADSCCAPPPSAGLAIDLSLQPLLYNEHMDQGHGQYNVLARPSSHELPALPVARTPPSSGSRLSQKSPTSFSSKSLGLDSLDFGYDKQVVGNLLPPSPGHSPSVSPLPSSRSNVTSSVISQDNRSYVVLSPRTPPTSYDVSLHKELSMATGIGINADSISIPLNTIDDHMSVIDLVDISILDEPDNASEIAVPVGSPSTTAITNDNTDSMMLVFCDDDAASYKEERGYVAPAMLNYSRRFCSSGTFPTNPSIPEEELESSPLFAPVSEVANLHDYSSSSSFSCSPSFDDDPDKSVNAQSPYAVRDIDELLVELGVAETGLIFDTVKDRAQNRESFCSRILTTSCSIRSSISFNEIDELIEQLERDRPGASASLDATKAAAFSASIADTIRSLGKVASLTRVIVPQPLPIDPLDVSTVMRGLGAVIVPDFACVRPRLFLDVAGLVSGLGAAIVPELLKDRWCLSLAAAATAAAMPSEQPSRRTGDTIGRSGSITVEDITRLITELGAVIVPKEPVVKPAPLDVASLVRGLGNPEAVIPTVVPSIICEQQPSRCLDIPDIIAGLGGVYVPTLSASVIDRIGEVDIHALFDTNADDVSDSGSCTSSSYWTTWTLSSLPDMDVDEIVNSVESSRSRANSIMTTVSETPSRLRQHANYHNDGISISRLIYALNIAPIFVRRPLLGPSRVVVFPHFY